ncbi:hypothetical protein M8C13_07005 [Crossiella sp. SN42]|nr:hypothetical protein [Crossiella sp. SN42]MCO1575505.1 hypothetical protein [Crossiella sp. SN42]
MQVSTGRYQVPLMLGAPTDFVLGCIVVLASAVALAVTITLVVREIGK